jgi:RNA polymerase sigma-70 factor (TIGR02957 family)
MRSHEKPHAGSPPPRTPTRPVRRIILEPSPNDSAENLADLARAADEFTAIQPRLFGIAYRMLGSAADAEDVVQEVWLRWQRYDRQSVREPAAFLATTTTRLALNLMQSARVRHEAYVGPWLPEPVDTGVSPELAAEHAETLEIGVLFLLERLSPTERAAYVLREAFDYPYSRIASTIDVTEANARQLVSRARKHLGTERHPSVTPSEQRRFLEAFRSAAQSGDVESLEGLLAEDVVSYSDGGGAAQAARFPLVGRTRVSKFVRAVSEWFWDGVEVQWVSANGRSAIRLAAHGEVIALLAISATAEGIDRLFWIVNPSKLDGVRPLTD